jgi:REP element-mobilizing transposase RayT
MKKFRNKYRIPSARAQWWDYANDGAYFITICTKGRECCFGDVVDGEMKLSHVGLLADVFWYEIKNHARNIMLDVFQVMPNHIHGILILDNNAEETTHDGDVENNA